MTTSSHSYVAPLSSFESWHEPSAGHPSTNPYNTRISSHVGRTSSIRTVGTSNAVMPNKHPSVRSSYSDVSAQVSDASSISSLATSSRINPQTPSLWSGYSRTTSYPSSSCIIYPAATRLSNYPLTNTSMARVSARQVVGKAPTRFSRTP